MHELPYAPAALKNTQSCAAEEVLRLILQAMEKGKAVCRVDKDVLEHSGLTDELRAKGYTIWEAPYRDYWVIDWCAPKDVLPG